MIDYRELDFVDDVGYPIFKTKEGEVVNVTLPMQKDLVMITKFQYLISSTKEEYKKLSNKKNPKEEDLDKIDSVYKKMIETIYDMFLFILNLNTKGKTFVKKEIERIPFKLIQQECDGYIEYVHSKLKN